MEHELKTDSPVFQAVKERRKNFEIRKNDRNFQVGDTLILKETQFTGAEMATDYSRNYRGLPPIEGKPLVYTGEELAAVVTYILEGPIYGLVEGWCILSIELL